MSKLSTRRQALKSITTVGVLGQGIARAQDAAIQIAGRPVEIAVSSVSPQTVRLTIQPLENGQPQAIPVDGALVKEDWGRPIARLRTLDSLRSVKCGDLTVKLSGNPLAIRVESKGGRLVQEFKVDATT